MHHIPVLRYSLVMPTIMPTIFDVGKERIENLDLLISSLKGNIASRPTGRLLLYRQRGVLRAYLVDEGTRKYLGKKELQLMKDLSQKQYESILLEDAVKEKTELTDFLQKYSSLKATPEKAIGRMNSYVRDLVTVGQSVEDEQIIQWKRNPFTQAMKTENHIFETMSKDLVRSKSEVLIADRLFVAGIPFRYEQSLRLKTKHNVYQFYPDFTILNKRTGVVFYWEHLGMVGDRSYCIENLQKLDIYAQFNIIQGKNLIISYECDGKPLSTTFVNRMIKEFLT